MLLLLLAAAAADPKVLVIGDSQCGNLNIPHSFAAAAEAAALPGLRPMRHT